MLDASRADITEFVEYLFAVSHVVLTYHRPLFIRHGGAQSTVGPFCLLGVRFGSERDMQTISWFHSDLCLLDNTIPHDLNGKCGQRHMNGANFTERFISRIH